MPNIVSTTPSKFLDELVDKSLNTRPDGALKLPEYQPPKEWTKESSTIQTPQTSGGSVSNAPKRQGVDVSETRVPLSHRNRKAFDWLETANTTISPTALNKPSSYESKRLTDTNSNFGMGGREVKLSGKEYTTAPRAAATGALEATEGMIKAPSVFMADYYKYGKDTYESKRESESMGRAQEQRAQRSADYKKENQAENDKKAQEWADKATSIDLYKEGTSLRDFINKTKADMQSLKEETEQDFTLADMAYTMGQMAPSIALGQAVGAATSAATLGSTSFGSIMSDVLADNILGGVVESGMTLGSIGSMYAQVYGNSFDEAIENGATLDEALNSAKSHAMIESFTELLGGGIPGMGGGFGTKFITNMADKTAAKFGGKGVEALLPKALGTVASVLSSPTGEMALDIIGEGVEEMISEAYEPLITSKDGNANWSDLVNWSDVALAGFRGALVSAVMQGGVAILQSGARDGIAYQYDEDTGRIKKVGPEGITQQVETAEGSAESSAAADAGVTEAETKDSVVPQNVSEAVAKGAPSVNETVDQTNRRTASRFLNSFVTSATPSSKAVFREGGALAERYREKFGDDYKALDAYKARQSRIDETLPLDATWEQIYDFFDRVVVPEIQAYTRYAEEQTAKNDYDYALENPNLEGIIPESLPADYVDEYKKANGLEMMPDAEVRQRIVADLANMDGEARLVEITKFAESAGINLEDVYGDGFLDLWSSQLQQDRALDLRERHEGRVKVEGLGVVGADELFDYAAQKYGADNFDALDDEQKAEIVDLFERAVADEQTKMKEFADSLNELGKPTGLKVVFDPELADETGSAYDRKTSTIHINPNTVSTYQAMRFFVAHELVHHAMNLFKGNPKQLAAFRQKLDDMAASVGVDIEQERGYWKEQSHYKEQWKYEEEPYARFLSELLGSYEMLIGLAQNNPAALYDLIGYVDNASKTRKTTNKEVKRAEAAIKSDLKAAKNKTLEKKAAKENAKTMKDIPEDVQETAKMSDGVNTVKEAQKIDDSKAPSESMEEARAKVEAANSTESSGNGGAIERLYGIKLGNLSDEQIGLIERYINYVEDWNGNEMSSYDGFMDSLSPEERAFIEAFEEYNGPNETPYATLEEYLNATQQKTETKKTTKKGTTKKNAPKKTATEEAFAPKSETAAEQTAKESVASEAVEPEVTKENAEPEKAEPTATEEAFTPKSEQPVEMPEKAKEMGFQRVDGKSQITFQQAVAGEGKSRRQRLEKEGEARQTEELDLNKPITIPSLPNVSFQVISHVPLGGTANGEPILTIRAVPDDSHGMSSKGGHRLLKDWEIRLAKKLGFSSPKRNGIYEHDFTREFWLSLQNAETDGILDKSTKTDDNDMFFEYTGIGEEDGARFQIVPKLNQKGEIEGEEIRLLFRDEKGNRKAADPNVKNTFKDTYGFKYDKNNPHGSGFYVPFTDEMAARLGLPAMTKKMRENNNLSYRRHMALLKGVATVPIADESFNGLDLGYNPSNRTLYLCKDGKAVFSLPYNEAVVNELLAQESDRTDVFREMSEDQQYLNDLTSGLQERNRERRFDNITATEEAERNEAAEKLNAEKPISASTEDRIAKQNARYAKDPNMVKVKYRNTKDGDEVWLPKELLRPMTTLAIAWEEVENPETGEKERTGKIERLNLAGRSEKKGHIGEMWDELYAAKGTDDRVLTPDAIRINPATGRQRSLTAYEIPEKIWTNKGDLVWDATNYDENAEDPGSTIDGINWDWFKREFEKLYGKKGNDKTDEWDEYVKAVKEAEERQAKEKNTKKLTRSGKYGKTTSTYSEAELDEMRKTEENVNAAMKGKKRREALNEQTEELRSQSTDYTPEELEMLRAQDEAAAEMYAEQQAAYDDYLKGAEETLKEESETQNNRRGWANQDWFFNTFDKGRKTKAKTDYEEAKVEERIRYKEEREAVERLARENAGEYESMDLLSVSPDRLVNDIYRGKNGRAKLLELLDLEVAKSTAADRFDEAAQFEYLKRTIEELDRTMTYAEDREAARGGTPEQRATIYDNTQKRLNILAQAYAEESAAAEDVKELAKLDDKENTKANVKKAKELQKSIEEHNNKADEYKAEAAKIAEAIGKLRAQIEQEFLKKYPEEAKTPVETKAKTGKAAKDAERFDLGSQRLALEKELALAKAEIEKATNRLNEEQNVEWSNDKNFPDKYRYASNNTLEEIKQLRDKIDRYDKAAEKREKQKKFWDKYIADKKAEIASLEKGVKPALKKKADSGTTPEASNTKVTEDDVKKARNELAEAENTRKSLDNVSESEQRDRAKYYRLTQAFTEARWKEAKDREIKRLKSDVKTAQARADEVRVKLAKVDSKLEKLTTKKITLDEILMGVEAAENDAMGVPEAVEAEREADNTLPYEEDEMLDVRPIPSRLKDTANRNLSTIQDEFYRSKPGSLNDEGDVQEYSTTYEEMPEEFGDGAYWLYIEGAIPEGESSPTGTESGLAAEKVYAAIENPMYPSEPAADNYESLESAVQSLAEDFGLPEGNYLQSLTEGQTILDAVRGAAEAIVAANPDRIDLGTAMNELVTLMGYDGILFMDGAVVFDQNNIKSVNDPDPANSTIGFTITDDMLNNMAKKSEAKRKILNNPEIERQWRLAQERRGTIGNTPIPQYVGGKKKVSTWNETAYELPNISVKDTPLEAAQKDAILSNMASYTVKTDADTLAEVKKWMEKNGFTKDGVLTNDAFAKMYNSVMKNGISSKEDVFKAGQVLTEMSNFARMYHDQVTDEMAEAWQYLYAKMSVTASKTGQILQAFSALRKLTPQGRLYYIQNVIEELRKELHERKGIGSNKIRNALDNYEIDPALIKEMNEVDFNDKAKVADIEARIAADIAKHIPATVGSRVRAYRYLCMLGSIRTHIRNISSNALMVAAKEGARFWSGLGQDIFVKEENKTTTLKRATEDQKAFAKKDSLMNEEALQYGGKRGFDTLINQYRKNFGNSPVGKFLERLSAFNGDMLEKEDLIFLNREYRRSLSKYMAAHNFTSAYFESNTAQALEDLNKAREYALNQAWDATYRQANIIAEALNSVEKKSPLASIIIEGLVPFKRTPMNIIIQGAHYSPIGILEGLGKFERMLVKGDITGAEVADRLGQGLTGTGILLLGFALGSMGVARASGDESDREEYYDQMLGEQKYSLRIGGHSYTIDWLTPISMPLMSGVELAELGKKKALMEDDDDDFNEWFNRLVTAISTMADPVTNLSMLQSINDVLSAYKDNQIGNLLMNAGQSYALQFVPTASGQALRTIDPTRRTTYAPTDSGYPFGKFGETFVNKLKNKSLIANAILGDNNEYVDQWGRTEMGEENPALRAFNQFIAPWYMRDFNSTAVDDKLAEVFAENGKNTAVLPATPQSNFSIDKVNYKLSGDEYEKVKKIVGGLSYRGLENAFASDIFNGMSADEQTEVIKDIYTYARQMAKIDYANKKGLQVWTSKKEQEEYLKDNPNAKGFVQESYVDKIATLEKYGYGVGDYFAIAKSISGLKKKQKERALRDMGLPYDVRQVFL